MVETTTPLPVLKSRVSLVKELNKQLRIKLNLKRIHDQQLADMWTRRALIVISAMVVAGVIWHLVKYYW